MKLKINGDDHELPERCTLVEMLNYFELDPDNVIVEMNGEIYRPAESGHISLHPDAAVEIVHFVGGGGG